VRIYKVGVNLLERVKQVWVSKWVCVYMCVSIYVSIYIKGGGEPSRKGKREVWVMWVI
jgi:hypothetical protein